MPLSLIIVLGAPKRGIIFSSMSALTNSAVLRQLLYRPATLSSAQRRQSDSSFSALSAATGRLSRLKKHQTGYSVRHIWWSSTASATSSFDKRHSSSRNQPRLLKTPATKTVPLQWFALNVRPNVRACREKSAKQSVAHLSAKLQESYPFCVCINVHHTKKCLAARRRIDARSLDPLSSTTPQHPLPSMLLHHTDWVQGLDISLQSVILAGHNTQKIFLRLLFPGLLPHE